MNIKDKMSWTYTRVSGCWHREPVENCCEPRGACSPHNRPGTLWLPRGSQAYERNYMKSTNAPTLSLTHRRAKEEKRAHLPERVGPPMGAITPPL